MPTGLNLERGVVVSGHRCTAARPSRRRDAPEFDATVQVIGGELLVLSNTEQCGPHDSYGSKITALRVRDVDRRDHEPRRASLAVEGVHGSVEARTKDYVGPKCAVETAAGGIEGPDREVGGPTHRASLGIECCDPAFDRFVSGDERGGDDPVVDGYAENVGT